MTEADFRSNSYFGRETTARFASSHAKSQFSSGEISSIGRLSVPKFRTWGPACEISLYFAKFRRNPAKNPASFEVVRIAAAAPVLAKAKEEAEAYEMERRDVLLVASLLCVPFRAIYLADRPGKK